MPELPEVETVRAGLEAVLSGHRIVRVDQHRGDLRFPLPERFAERLTGRTVMRLDRRAKYILVHLDQAEVLVVHLGMTGRFSVELPHCQRATHVPSRQREARRGNGRGQGQQSTRTHASRGPPHANPLPRPQETFRESAQLGEFTHAHGHDAKHDHLVFTMSHGAVVTYNDARRFGYMTLVPERGLNDHVYFSGLGVEPLGEALTPHYLAGRAAGKKVDAKALLMDQRIVAGLGNIYVCEALFRARLDPSKSAARLATSNGKPAPAAVRLVAAIKAVLADAVKAGGSTLRDYKQADGSLGRFQHHFAVYGREGQPCLRPGCRGRVRRKTQGGRSTFYCPACQR
jgi:formamidopyrimidine-DNA glycosylase